MINLYEAKTKLSSLVERAASGEEIVIAKAGRPLARLMPLAQPADSPRKKRDVPFGLLKGQIRVGPDFDKLDKEIEDAFEGLAE
jgi:prevent-host-death family protein